MSQRPQISVRRIREYTGHKGSIYAMVVDSAERYLYTAGDDGIVARWDLHAEEDEGKGVLRIPTAIYSLILLEEHNILVVGCSDGTLHFVDLPAEKIKHSYRKTEKRVFDLWYDETYGYVWFLQADGWLGVMDVNRMEEVGYQQIAEHNLRKIIAAPSDDAVLIGASDGKIRILHKQSGAVQASWQAHKMSVFAMCRLDNGQLLSGGRDAHLNQWEWQGAYLPMQKVPAHNFTINDLALSPDQSQLVTASRDKTIKLWNSENLQLLKVVDAPRHGGHTHSVNKIKWLKSDNSVISGSDDKRIIRWHLSIDS